MILISAWEPFQNSAKPIQLFLTLYKTNHLLVKRLEEQLQRYELTLGRLCVLVALKSYDRPMLPSEISDDLAVTRANVSGLLNILENNGHVQRNFDTNNRRRILVQLTAEGAGMLDKLWPVYNETIISGISDKLTAEEQDTLLKLIKKLG